MAKKLTIFLIIAVNLLGVSGLTACDGIRLADYKSTKANELQAYAEAKGENNYTAENWALLQQEVTKGKTAIKKAVSKTAVDTVVTTAKTAINAVEREDANLEWTNDNAVYAFVKAGYETEILKNVESAFSSLNFQKVYVVEKNVNVYTPLALLFVLNESGADKRQEFIDLLSQDTSINHAGKNRDLPFETVDTRYIDKSKGTIAVGETLTLEAKGNIDYYVQPFGFKGLLVKSTTSITYTVADFPVNLKSVEARDNGWLYLELAAEGYFNIVKALDILSRLSTIEKVESDKSEIVLPVPPIWQISDISVANYINEADMYKYNLPLTIIGVKPGIVTISRDGISCEITVQ